jgi:hypothetical protein
VKTYPKDDEEKWSDRLERKGLGECDKRTQSEINNAIPQRED